MAKGDNPDKAPAPPKPEQQPQQNQYLTGNPNTDPNAQTNWMKPTNDLPSAGNTGINGGAVQNLPAPTDGTMLGQITSGSTTSNQVTPGKVGQYMPQGFDQGKFNDPGKHDPKYDIGRILSKYPPNPAGLQAAAPELQSLGYKVVGADKIVGPDGFPVDVGQGFSDAAARGGNGNWWWNPSNPGQYDNSNWMKPSTTPSYAGSQPPTQPVNNQLRMNSPFTNWGPQQQVPFDISSFLGNNPNIGGLFTNWINNQGGKTNWI